MDRTPSTCVGLPVFAVDGTQFGVVSGMFVQLEDGSASWIEIGDTASGQSVVAPARGAFVDDDGVDLPHSTETLLSAPYVLHSGELDWADEAQLRRHYGIDHPEGLQGPGPDAAVDRPAVATEEGVPAETAAPGADEDGPFVLRSEEELRISTETHATGTVRMRKWVETEHVSEEVELHREHLRVESEPIPPGNRPSAPEGVVLADAEYVVALHDEHLVATKVAVPREVVRLSKFVVVEPYVVEADLRQEQVVVEQDGVPVEAGQGGTR